MKGRRSRSIRAPLSADKSPFRGAIVRGLRGHAEREGGASAEPVSPSSRFRIFNWRGGNLLKGGGTVRAAHFTRLSAGANPGETLTTAQTPAPENVSARSHHDVSFRSLDNLDVRVFVFVLERSGCNIYKLVRE